jgi:hypothetical protein
MRAFTPRALVVLLAACSSVTPQDPTPVSATNHTTFPITASSTHPLGGSAGVDGTFTCDSCHRPGAESFTQVRCDVCHRHPQVVMPMIHQAVSGFAVDTSDAGDDADAKAELRGPTCARCHPTGAPRALSHTGITGGCADCHAEGASFAALPVAGFNHPAINGNDCGMCHQTTKW